jgi:hypothetical protein
MAIKLTKTINKKPVELEIIFLNGKTVVADKCFNDLKSKGITKSQLKKAGFSVEADELKAI